MPANRDFVSLCFLLEALSARDLNSFKMCVCVCIHAHVHIHMYMYICKYVYTYSFIYCV